MLRPPVLVNRREISEVPISRVARPTPLVLKLLSRVEIGQQPQLFERTEGHFPVRVTQERNQFGHNTRMRREGQRADGHTPGIRRFR